MPRGSAGQCGMDRIPLDFKVGGRIFGSQKALNSLNMS